MSCRRAFDIDLAGFLSEPSRDEFTEFREHYPICPECAAEVRAWTDLHVLLQSGAAVPNGGHPEPQLLLRYEQGEERLGAAAATDLERHLVSCASCRDELAALRRFDFAVLEARAPRGSTARERVATLAGWVRTLFVHPAFAYALVLVLLYPAAMSYFSDSNAPDLGPARSRTAVAAPEPPARDLSALRSAAPESPSGSVVPSQTRVAPSELLEPRKQAVRMQAVPGMKGEEEAGAAPGASSYRRAPAPPQAGIEEAGGPERPLADVYDAPQLELMRGAPQSEHAKAVRPSWALRLRVPDDVRGAPHFEVRVVHRDGRRELRQRFDTAAVGEAVEVLLPLDWDPTDEDRAEFRAIP